MKINHKVLSIPPYISTSWKHVTSLHVEMREDQVILVVGLSNGTGIEIPDLQQPVIEAIFAIHAKLIEGETSSPSKAPPHPDPQPKKVEQTVTFGLPLSFGLEGMQQMNTLIQHNPEQSDAPDLPVEILSKVGALAKALGLEDPAAIPKPEPHCNCHHCQIARVLNSGFQEPEAALQHEEEKISEEDLKFRDWDISQMSDKLYQVINPLDLKECYNVYLGDPIGCTCGTKNCEHIRAVLNT